MSLPTKKKINFENPIIACDSCNKELENLKSCKKYFGLNYVHQTEQHKYILCKKCYKRYIPQLKKDKDVSCIFNIQF